MTCYWLPPAKRALPRLRLMTDGRLYYHKPGMAEYGIGYIEEGQIVIWGWWREELGL